MNLTCASTIIFFKLLCKKLQEWRSVTVFFKLLARHKFMLTEAVFAAKGIDGFSKHLRFLRGGNRVYWSFIYFLCNTSVAGAGLEAWIQVPVKEMSLWAQICMFWCKIQLLLLGRRTGKDTYALPDLKGKGIFLLIGSSMGQRQF